MNLDEMALARGMVPQVYEVTHGGRAQRIATRVLALEDITKVKGHINLDLDHQGHTSPRWDHKGHIAPRILGSKAHLMLRGIKSQGPSMHQINRSTGHVSQGQPLHLRPRIEDAALNVES